MDKVDGCQTLALEYGLAVLLNIQHEVSAMVPGAITNAPPTPDQIRTYFLALIVETVELMNELPGWKPWKKPKLMNPEYVMDEFADILAFLGVILNYLRELGIDPADLADAYARKTNINIARFNGEVEGYGVKDGSQP